GTLPVGKDLCGAKIPQVTLRKEPAEKQEVGNRQQQDPPQAPQLQRPHHHPREPSGRTSVHRAGGVSSSRVQVATVAIQAKLRPANKLPLGFPTRMESTSREPRPGQRSAGSRMTSCDRRAGREPSLKAASRKRARGSRR